MFTNTFIWLPKWLEVQIHEPNHKLSLFLSPLFVLLFYSFSYFPKNARYET